MFETLLNFTLWLCSGAALGWLAFGLINANAQYTISLNVLVGALGAIVSGALYLWSSSHLQQFSMVALCVALLGAVFAVAALTVLSTCLHAHRGDCRTRILLR